MEKVVPPDPRQVSCPVQNGHWLILPGQTSLSLGMNRQRSDVISIVKPYLSEKMRVLRRSAPLPPALKSKGIFEE